MTTSRYLCPLDCGWHHDQPDPMPDLALAKLPLPTPDLAYVLTLGHLHGVEAILRAHLETHTLLEWVQALQASKQQLVDEKARQEAYEESVVGALNERNTRDCQRAETAEAQVARIRAFLEDMATWCSPHGIAADYSRRGLDALDGVDPLSAVTRACSCGRTPDPGVCPVQHSVGLPAGGHCACACDKEQR